MFELSVRVIGGALLMAVSGATGIPPFDFSAKIALLAAGYGAFAFLLERRGLRSPSASTLIAGADIFAVASVCAMTGTLGTAGSLVLIPCIAAIRFHRSIGSVLVPVSAASLLIAANLFGSAQISAPILSQAAAVLAVGFLVLNQAPIVTESAPFVGAQETTEIRESYRKLRDEYRTLERQTRQDRIAVAVFEAIHQMGGGLAERLAARLQQLCGVQHTTICLSNAIGTTLHAIAASPAHSSMDDLSVDLDVALSDAIHKDRVAEALAALQREGAKANHASVFLKHGSNLVGMILLEDDSLEKLTEGERRAADAAPYVAAAIATHEINRAQARRLRESDLLYMIAATARGAETKSSLATRVVREMQDILDLDFVAVSLLESGEEIPVVSQKLLRDFIESISFAYGSGLTGWSKTGSHEVWISDTANDERIAKELSIKTRIASLAIMPMRVDNQPLGLIMTAGRRPNSIDEATIECLRVVSAELAHAIAGLSGQSGLPQGLATPSEFHAALANRPPGALVYIEPIRTDKLIDTFGRPAIIHATRVFAQRLRTMLPAGTLVCRRNEGDFVAHVIGDAEEAAKWANEITVQAALIGIRTPDGKSRIPFAVKAKVAELSVENYQVLQELAA